MKKINLALVALVLMGGCQQRSRFVDPAPAGSYWSGTATVNGAPENVGLFLMDGTADPSELRINYGAVFSAKLSGSLSGNTLNYTADEGSLCTNKWTVTGSINGNALNLTLVGQGNIVPGTHCYDKPLNLTAMLSK